MKRSCTYILVLLLLAFRSFLGTARTHLLPVEDTVNAPISVSRSKKPFPFNCVQLTKKKISNPPLTGQNLTFNGYLNPSPECEPLLYNKENCCLILHAGETGTVALLPLTPDWYIGKDQAGVFRPPPVAI